MSRIIISNMPMILSRSPYWVKYAHNSDNYDYITISLFIWKGDKYNIPLEAVNTFTAYRTTVGGYAITSVNISDYVKSYIKPYLEETFLYDSDVNDFRDWDGCVWVSWRILSFKINQLNGNGVVYEDINTFSSPRLATLGYSYYNEGVNYQPSKVFISQSLRYGLKSCIHYKTELNTSTNDSNNIITRTLEIPSKKLIQGKDPIYQVFFLNRYGVWDSFDFNKVFKRSVNIKSDEVQNLSPTPYSSSYLLTGISRTQNINVEEEYIMNTDLLDDYQNKIIEEMCLSDRWFLLNPFSQYFTSIVLTDKKFDEKVGRNDKANIQWSFKFKLGYNKINDIK